jgi:hypothetical protein
MKFLVKAEFPNDAGNAFVKNPSWSEKIQGILQDQKAESPHFLALDGHRTCLYFVNINDSAKIPSIAEPWWLMVQAKVDVTPVMAAEDFAKAAPDIIAAVKKYGQS